MKNLCNSSLDVKLSLKKRSAYYFRLAFYPIEFVIECGPNAILAKIKTQDPVDWPHQKKGRCNLKIELKQKPTILGSCFVMLPNLYSSSSDQKTSVQISLVLLALFIFKID